MSEKKKQHGAGQLLPLFVSFLKIGAFTFGVTKTTMSKYENNVNIPNADILARLASVLRTSADYLCGITDNCAPLGEKWICTDSVDESLITAIKKLNHDNQLRLAERAETLLEKQNKTAE